MARERDSRNSGTTVAHFSREHGILQSETRSDLRKRGVALRLEIYFLASGIHTFFGICKWCKTAPPSMRKDKHLPANAPLCARFENRVTIEHVDYTVD